MGMFTVIATDAFDALQTDAGVILTKFDPYNPWKKPTDDEILMTTTGGVNPTAVPSFTDYASDVDNAVDNMKEFKRITSWTVTLGTTSIKFNAENAKWSLGAAEKEMLSNGVTKITPRKDIKQTDFTDLWWVGDKANGGAYAIHILNALSTGGLNIQSSKGGKGTNAITITGHVSLANQEAMPMEIYDIPPEDMAPTVKITQNLDDNTESTITAASIDFGEALTGTLSAKEGYVLDTVHIVMGNSDITEMSGVYNDNTGEINITAVTNDVVITASSVEE